MNDLSKGEKTYNRILDAAMKIISTEGVSGISASKISKISGISKSTVFHHFETIYEVPILVMKMILNEVKKPIIELEANTLYEYVSLLGETTIAFSKKSNVIYMCLIAFYHESIFHDKYQQYMSQFLLESKIEFIKRIQAYTHNDVSEEQLEIFASSILSSLDGIGLNAMLSDDKEGYVKAWKSQMLAICTQFDALKSK